MPWIERYRDIEYQPIPASVRTKRPCQDCRDMKNMVLCLGVTLAIVLAILFYICYYVL